MAPCPPRRLASPARASPARAAAGSADAGLPARAAELEARNVELAAAVAALRIELKDERRRRRATEEAQQRASAEAQEAAELRGESEALRSKHRVASRAADDARLALVESNSGRQARAEGGAVICMCPCIPHWWFSLYYVCALSVRVHQPLVGCGCALTNQTARA